MYSSTARVDYIASVVALQLAAHECARSAGSSSFGAVAAQPKTSSSPRSRSTGHVGSRSNSNSNGISGRSISGSSSAQAATQHKAETAAQTSVAARAAGRVAQGTSSSRRAQSWGHSSARGPERARARDSPRSSESCTQSTDTGSPDKCCSDSSERGHCARRNSGSGSGSDSESGSDRSIAARRQQRSAQCLTRDINDHKHLGQLSRRPSEQRASYHASRATAAPSRAGVRWHVSPSAALTSRKPPTPLVAVVFGGGGSRGWTFLGALRRLKEDLGIDWGARSPPLRAAAGTSIGAVPALGIVLGYSVEELFEQFAATDETKLLALNPALLLTHGAMNDGSALREHLQAMIFAKLGVSDLTLGELRERTRMALFVATYNLHRARVEHLGPDTTPHLSVVEAVIASMSVPGLLPPARLALEQPSVAGGSGSRAQENAASALRARVHRAASAAPAGDALSACVDGGLADNLPMRLFAPGAAIGFRLDWSVGTVASSELDTTYGVAQRIFSCALNESSAMEWRALDDARKACVITLSTGASPLIHLTDAAAQAAKTSLIDAGYQCTRDALRASRALHSLFQQHKA